VPLSAHPDLTIFSLTGDPTICIQRQCGCDIYIIIEMEVMLKAEHSASAGTGDLSILFKYYTAMVEFMHFIHRQDDIHLINIFISIRIVSNVGLYQNIISLS
jgi:hypothetical protein